MIRYSSDPLFYPLPHNPEPLAVFMDSGCILGNPSEYGVTVAYCWVGADDTIIPGREFSTYVTLAQLRRMGGPRMKATNNVGEMAAMLKALESLPDGWGGWLITDSENVYKRLNYAANNGKWRWEGIPQDWGKRIEQAFRRLDLAVCFKYLKTCAGHPTKEELALGYRKDNGLPVSGHNVYCDKLCTAQAKVYKQKYLTGKGMKDDTVLEVPA